MAFNMSEEDMAHFLKEFDTSVEIDIEGITECVSLQTVAKKTTLSYYIDFEINAVSESKHGNCFPQRKGLL